MTRPTFLSLFSGIGGLDLGLERAGWSCVGQVEIDPFCQRVLAKHWPDVPRWGDIREVDPDDLPRTDLIAGGFPCQPVSTAGRRRGQDDERWLWPEFHRIVRALRPRWVLVENVPGLLARGMGDVLGDLAACGYDAEWDCIPAAAVGAPHRRDRVWIVAYPQRERGRLQPELQPGSSGQAFTGDNGQAWPLAHTNGFTLGQGRRPSGSEPQGCQPTGSGGDVADPAGTRRPSGPPRAGGSARDEARRPGPSGLGGEVADPDGAGRWPGSRLGWPWPAIERDRWWAAEPNVGRVAHGVPARLDRLRSLGNAVVPQVAELIGRALLETEA